MCVVNIYLPFLEGRYYLFLIFFIINKKNYLFSDVCSAKHMNSQ